MEQKNKSNTIWKIYGLVLTILFIFAVFTKGFSFKDITGRAILDENTAAQKAVDYINNNLVIEDRATLISVVEENELYRIEIELQGQILEAYITKNGKVLITNAILLEESVE